VLERYGLATAVETGPRRAARLFATVHRLLLDATPAHVRAAAAGAASSPTPAAKAANPFSPHFIVRSLLTLTLGATTGMINLLRIAAGGEVPLDHKQIHGHTQVLGFAMLFLMGIAYHALPRILGIGGARPGLSVRVSFWLMFLGVVLRNVGQPLGLHPAGRLVSLLSAAMEVPSASLFALFVFDPPSPRSRGQVRPTDPAALRESGHDHLLAGIASRGLGVCLPETPTRSFPPR
jgi:hypothetical protein